MRNRIPLLFAGIAYLSLGLLIFAARPALGGAPKTSGRATLAAVGDEPFAQGNAAITVYGWPDEWFTGSLSVNCKNLAGGGMYVVVLYFNDVAVWVGNPIVARSNGNFAFKSDFGSSDPPTGVGVYRVEPTGNVLVLAGTFGSS